ncbi:MAG: hypothetical protein NXI00_02395 [Cytophagales bacterium]|nr:hypothetical protein [Cytophagales bacterium]
MKFGTKKLIKKNLRFSYIIKQIEMKKLIAVMLVAGMTAFTACSSEAETTEEAAVVEETVEEEAPAEVAVDSVEVTEEAVEEVAE